MDRSHDFVNQWGAFGKTMLFYRWIAIGGLLLSFLSVTALVASYYQSPLVVIKNGKNEYYIAQREDVEIENIDVELFAIEFVKSFYGNNPNKCTISDGLQTRINKIQGNKIEQYVGKISIVLEEKSTHAKFDLIMTIKDIPIVVRKNIELQVIQGENTACNPLGLYINGIKEREVK